MITSHYYKNTKNVPITCFWGNDEETKLVKKSNSEKKEETQNKTNIKKIVLTNEEIDPDKFCKCALMTLGDDDTQAVVVGQKLLCKIDEILEAICDFRGGYDYNITYNCYVEKSKLNQSNIYTKAEDFFKDFPEILDLYLASISLENKI